MIVLAEEDDAVPKPLAHVCLICRWGVLRARAKLMRGETYSRRTCPWTEELACKPVRAVVCHGSYQDAYQSGCDLQTQLCLAQCLRRASGHQL